MKKLLFLILLFFMIIKSQMAFSESFVVGTEDIPLMKNLSQANSNTLFFGNEETRYIEIELYATSELSFSEVKSFYIKALSQLGWTIKESKSNFILFYRETDVLEIKLNSTKPLKISLIIKNNN